MRLKDRALITLDRIARSLQWIAASHHLRTDPACAQFRAPRPGSRLDRRSRGEACTRCMARRAFGWDDEASQAVRPGGD